MKNTDRLFAVFVRRGYHHVAEWQGLDFDSLQMLQRAGWCMVWDSAPDRFIGAQYAARHYAAPTPSERIFLT